VIANGNADATPLVAKVREWEARRAAIASEIAALQPVPRLPVSVVESRLAEWRRLLRQSMTQARAVLQRVLDGRITFLPDGDGYPTWGAPKIRERLRQRCPDVQCPAISTVHAVLDRHGLVTRRKRRRPRAEGTPLSHPGQPNDLWCADYKGEFMLANRRYCYPLTVTDYASRYLLTCDALTTTKEMYAFTVFERTFQDFGLPRAIRTDNGVPFASAHALYGLSKLAVWWLRLGIQIERIRPGHPEQNGRHERMHLTLKTEATKPAAANVLQQQARFDTLIDRFNHERPHQALGMKVPGALYTRSRRLYHGLVDLQYPLHDWTGTVTHCGRICYKSRKINLSQVFAGQDVGVKQVSDRIWLVTFMDYDLGYFDDETCRLEPLENPFGPKVLPMSSE